MAALLGDGIQRDRVRFELFMFYVGDRKDRSALSPEPDSGCDWYLACAMREALTPDAIVAHRATYEKYGFEDFKLKGGVLTAGSEAEGRPGSEGGLPKARITWTPNGGWLLKDALA